MVLEGESVQVIRLIIINLRHDMLQMYAENQLERPENERIGVERDRRKQRICSHCQEPKAAILRPHDPRTESLYAHFRWAVDDDEIAYFTVRQKN